jgi:hypothetical protein
MVSINMFKNYLAEDFFSPPKMRSTYTVSINSNSSSKNQYNSTYLPTTTTTTTTTNGIDSTRKNLNPFRNKYLSTTFLNLPLLKPYELKSATDADGCCKKVNLLVTRVSGGGGGDHDRCNNNHNSLGTSRNRNRATSFIYIDDDRSSLDRYSEDELDLSESSRLSGTRAFNHNKLKTDNFQQGALVTVSSRNRNGNGIATTSLFTKKYASIANVNSISGGTSEPLPRNIAKYSKSPISSYLNYDYDDYSTLSSTTSQSNQTIRNQLGMFFSVFK